MHSTYFCLGLHFKYFCEKEFPKKKEKDFNFGPIYEHDGTKCVLRWSFLVLDQVVK